MSSDEPNRAFVGPEQQAEIERFRGEVLGLRRELRDVQGELRGDIERLQTTTKAINIAGVPALVAIVAVVLGWLRVRKRRPAAA